MIHDHVVTGVYPHVNASSLVRYAISYIYNYNVYKMMATMTRTSESSETDGRNILEEIKRTYIIGKHMVKNNVWVVRRTPDETTMMSHN